jgi:hypothetical protein
MTLQTRRDRLSPDRRRGQALLLVTFCLIPMMGIIGLVVDVGFMYFLKKSAQTAADAAAWAAVIEFNATNSGTSFTCGVGGVVCQTPPASCDTALITPTNPLESGCLYAKQNGFTTSGRQTVTYQANVTGHPPTAPGMNSAAYWVTYRVTQSVPQLFSAVLGNTSGLVAARATAALAPSRTCIYLLSPTAPAALYLSGTSSLISSCGIYINSVAANALSTSGSAQLSAPEYNIVGGFQTATPLTPEPNIGVQPSPDPLASLPTPASAPYTCNHNNYSAPNWSNPTLTPGVYCGGINVGNNRYTLRPGNYILVGGGLTTQSANSAIIGEGVMIYNTFGPTNLGNRAYAPINLAANSTVTLRAASSGVYAGILFFGDRNAPATSETYGGGSSAVYQGTIYSKNAAITMFGNSSLSAQYTIVVARTMSLVGTTGFNNNYSSLLGGPPIKQVALVE